MNTLQEIAEVLKGLKSVTIFTHTRPDGDAIGSALSLSSALDELGVENEVLNEGEIPARFSYLPKIGKIKKFPKIDAEGYIAVDSSDEGRFGQLRDFYLTGAMRKVTVNIDHHVSNTRYAKYNFVRERASNCENMVELIGELGVEINREIALYLMTGLVTDSGAFTHSDVNGDTFRTAASLSDRGADVNLIHYETMRKQSKKRADFSLAVLSRMRYYLDDSLAITVVGMKDLESYSLKADATEGLVDFALSVEPVEVSVCLLEVKKGQYKASFRSKGKVNVNEVAAYFGGGGHILASGCMLSGSEEEVIERILYAVSAYTEDE